MPRPLTLKKSPPGKSPGLSAFKGSSYSSINDALRTEGGLDKASPSVKSHVENLDKFFARPGTTLGKDMIVSRKLTAHANDPDTKHLLTVQPGDVVGDQGFGSTSGDPSVWHGNFHVQLHTPAEAKVALPGVHTSTNEGYEKEVVLNRGHQYRIISVHPPGKDKLEGDPDGWSWEHGAHRVKAELIVPGLNDDATKAKASGKKVAAHKTLSVGSDMDTSNE